MGEGGWWGDDYWLSGWGGKRRVGVQRLRFQRVKLRKVAKETQRR
jgi:hypothetical protein